jgi:hypothetical protein
MFCPCATGSCAISALVWPFDRKWRQLRDRKRPCPEVCSAHARLFPALFLSSSNMATGCDLRSLDPFGVPLGVLMRNRKLHNTGSDRKSLDPFGSVHGVFSMTSASYNHRKPRILYLAWWLELNTRILYLAWLLELNTRVLYLAWWLELALVICTFYFHIGCVVLLRVHLKISTYKHAFFLYFYTFNV